MTMPHYEPGATQISLKQPKRRIGWLLLAACMLLVVVVVAAELALLVHRVSVLGTGWSWAVGGAACAVLAVVAILCWQELIGWLRVRRVERLRDLMSAPLEHSRATRRLAHVWMRSLPKSPHAEAMCEEWSVAVHAGDDLAASAALKIFLDAVDDRVDSEIRREAARTGIIVSLSGIALLDALLCIWRNLRLMRCIATEYGARPGLVGTVRLLRMVLLHAVAVDLTQHAAEAVSTRIGTVAAAGGQGLIAATLTVRIGLWTQQVCRPIPAPRRSIAGFAVASAADEVSIRVRRTVERAAGLLRVKVGSGVRAN
jgi:putative membrane protein